MNEANIRKSERARIIQILESEKIPDPQTELSKIYNSAIEGIIKRIYELNYPPDA